MSAPPVALECRALRKSYSAGEQRVAVLKGAEPRVRMAEVLGES